MDTGDLLKAVTGQIGFSAGFSESRSLGRTDGSSSVCGNSDDTGIGMYQAVLVLRSRR